MSEDLGPKLKRVAQILLASRGASPGAKGWELRRLVGRDYKIVIEALNSELQKLDLEVRKVLEEGGEEEEARYFITFKGPPPIAAATGPALRIDDVAMMAAALAYMQAKGGRASRPEIEALLREKFPRWRVIMNLRRFTRMGYLREDQGIFMPGWRTMAEVDLKLLATLVASLPVASQQVEKTT